MSKQDAKINTESIAKIESLSIPELDFGFSNAIRCVSPTDWDSLPKTEKLLIKKFSKDQHAHLLLDFWKKGRRVKFCGISPGAKTTRSKGKSRAGKNYEHMFVMKDRASNRPPGAVFLYFSKIQD